MFARPAFALRVNLLFRTPSLLSPAAHIPPHSPRFLSPGSSWFSNFPLFVVRSIFALYRASRHGRATIPIRRFFHAGPVDVADRIDSTDPIALSKKTSLCMCVRRQDELPDATNRCKIRIKSDASSGASHFSRLHPSRNGSSLIQNLVAGYT